MCKYFVLIYVCFTAFISSAQKVYKITYDTSVINDSEVRSTDVLWVGANDSYYEEGVKKHFEEESFKRISQTEVVIKKNIKEVTTTFVFQDFILNKLFNQFESTFEYKSFEELPKMTWKLLDEYKQFKDDRLQKAELKFRGRTYIAWCNLDIPITIGPWKFSNAPGLIYEITTDENGSFYSWYLKDFTRVEEKVLEVKKKQVNSAVTQFLPLRDVVQLIDNQLFSNENILSTRLPEGFIVESVDNENSISKNTRRTKLEINYEWEK